MYNEDYFEYIKKKPFDEKLRAFGNAMESYMRNSYESTNHNHSKEDCEYYNREAHGQWERAEFLFANLIEDYERK